MEHFRGRLQDDAEDMAEPILVSGPDAPWSRVRQAVAWHGHALVCADWHAWLPGALADPELRPLLGPHDWQRFNGLADPQARARFAATRLMFRHTAAAALQSEPELIDLAYKPGGRPYLRGCDQLDVSLSHTRDLIVVGLNRRGRVGVDTELASRRIRFAEVERLLCTPGERRLLAPLPEPERERELLRAWTLKEAYTKAIGQGMRMGFHQFGFDHDGRLRSPDGAVAAPGEWSFATYRVLDEYLVSIACHNGGMPSESDLAVNSTLDAGFTGQILELIHQHH